MNEEMKFPETFEKFAQEYGFNDDKEVYTNGLYLIPIFRVKQWLEHDNKLRTLETDTVYEYDKQDKIPVMFYPQVEGITPTVVEPNCNSIKTEQELSRDMEEIKEIVNCDTNVEIKLKMITNIICSKPHYFKALQQEEPCKNEISISRQIEEEILKIISDQINGDNHFDGLHYPEQKPCTYAISQEDALQALCKAVHKNDDTIPCPNQRVSCLWNKTKVSDYAEEILKLPPVTPQPKTGHWVLVDEAHEHARCSECDYGVIDLMDGKPHNYCQNCGIKMQEV